MADPTDSLGRFENRVVRVADLAILDDVVRGASFENCQIIGPAVVAFMQCVLDSCTFTGDMDAILWELPPERVHVLGAIAFQECGFRRCRFERIGIAGPASSLEPFRNLPQRDEGQKP